MNSRLYRFILGLGLLLLCQVAATAQETGAVSPPRSVELPRAFAKFSAGNVLQRVFDSYHPASGRVATLRDQSGKPALVRINEAKLWRAQGQEHLVVIVELAAEDYQFEGGLCGNCGTYAILAVLREKGGTLTLVAKQDAGASTAVSEEDDNQPDKPDGAMFYTGHSELSLDLAPYKLNARETLIGVRVNAMWLPAHTNSTTLHLYRIEGQRVREVFSDLVVEREYPEGLRNEGQTVLRTVATVIPEPSRQKFYDLRIEKASVRCFDRNEDWDCDSQDGTVHRIGRQHELWRFDGTRFNRVKAVDHTPVPK